MAEAILETKKWGNSIGVVLPREILENEGIKGEHEKLFVLVKKRDETAREAFGVLKHLRAYPKTYIPIQQ